jgi:hypothetical protein
MHLNKAQMALAAGGVRFLLLIPVSLNDAHMYGILNIN